MLFTRFFRLDDNVAVINSNREDGKIYKIRSENNGLDQNHSVKAYIYTGSKEVKVITDILLAFYPEYYVNIEQKTSFQDG